MICVLGTLHNKGFDEILFHRGVKFAIGGESDDVIEIGEEVG